MESASSRRARGEGQREIGGRTKVLPYIRRARGRIAEGVRSWKGLAALVRLAESPVYPNDIVRVVIRGDRTEG